LNSRLVIVIRIILEDNAINLVCCASQPALLHIVQNDLDLGLGACDVSEFADRYAQSSAEKTAQMGRRVGKLVGLPITLFEGYEDAHVVFTGKDLDGGTCELGSDLVKTAGSDTLLGAGDIEGAHRGVM
jgi:hypothetical protein